MWLKFVDHGVGCERLVNSDSVSHISAEQKVTRLEDGSLEYVFRLVVYLSGREIGKDEAGGHKSFHIKSSDLYDELTAIQTYICDCLENNVTICDLENIPSKKEM